MLMQHLSSAVNSSGLLLAPQFGSRDVNREMLSRVHCAVQGCSSRTVRLPLPPLFCFSVHGTFVLGA